jgi:hypothetical protein
MWKSDARSGRFQTNSSTGRRGSGLSGFPTVAKLLLLSTKLYIGRMRYMWSSTLLH